MDARAAMILRVRVRACAARRAQSAEKERCVRVRACGVRVCVYVAAIRHDERDVAARAARERCVLRLKKRYAAMSRGEKR